MSKENTSKEHCGLKHHKDDPKENHESVDYIVQPMGYDLGGDMGIAYDELKVPICEECLEAMHDQLWVLLYCFNCNESQWIHRPEAKREYTEKITWFAVCPHCVHDEPGTAPKKGPGGSE